MTLLGPDDPAPVRVTNPAGGSRYVLIGDHAGRRFPATLGDMGIAPADAARHIAWDIGVAALGQALADRIDAVFIEQRYSRLVVDCNRGPDEASAIPPVSDGTAIPANHDLSAADRAARFAEVHEPYQRAVGAELARRDALGRQGIVVALHPGTVDTPLSRPFQANVRPGALFTPDRAAVQLLDVIDALKVTDSGRHLDWEGKEITP